MSTFFVKKENANTKQWQIVDARDQILGRLAVKIAGIVSGKNRTDFTPHVDTGDGVIVINASHVRVTGNKPEAKLYKSYSGYPGGLKERNFERVMREDPTYVIKNAVKGMLPKSRLGSKMMTRLLVYPGSEHPHQAQKPQALKV